MDGEWFDWGMNEWEEGISKWRTNRVKSTFKKKYGRSLGSSRKSSHFSRRHKMSARHSRSNMQRLHRVSPKMQKEWAKGVSQWVAQREVVRSNHYFLKKFGIIKGNSSEEWKEGMQKWMDQNLLNKSWKWRVAKGKSNPSKNRRRIKRLNQQLQLYKKEQLRDDFPSSKIDKENKSHALQTNEEIPSQEFQIYLFKNEKQFGPYSLENIENFLTNDQLKLDDLAYYKGCGNWIKVQQIPGLNFNENIEIHESLTIGSEQSKEVLEIENLEKDKEENFKKEDEPSKDLRLLEKQMKTEKSILFTFGIYSLVGVIACLVYGLGYYHGAAVDKTVIIKNFTETEKTSSQNMARLSDKKSEFRQTDEVKKASLSNQDFEDSSSSPFGSYFSVKEAGGLEMLWVEPGNFVMGKMGHVSTRGVGSQQKVSITNGFYLGKYEVTQSQYKAVMQGNDYELESNPSRSKGEKEPVTSVSWDDIQIFLKILNSKERNAGRLPLQWNYSLPTEAEWEYACRAGTTTRFSWGDEIDDSLANCLRKIGRQVQVGQYPPNVWGFYDMHGNVWERVFDWSAHYSEQNEIDPSGPLNGTSKISRGGSWMSYEQHLFSYSKVVSDTKHVNGNTGFRLALRFGLLGDNKRLNETKIDAKNLTNTEKTENNELTLQKKQMHVVELNSSVRLEMLWVNPGTFTMGSPTSEPGRSTRTNWEDEHNVTLTKGFYLGKYEVTQAQYEAVMTGNTLSLSATLGNWPNNPTRPVERVSHDDIQIFLSRLNAQQSANISAGWSYVLPTEAEWEYACRAGTTTAYSWGATIATSNANYSTSGLSQTSAAGNYAANPWGFFDMHGNVFEWTADWFSLYSYGAQTDPTGPASGSARVIRGGSWHLTGTGLRSAARGNGTPSSRYTHIGFRVGFKQQ